MATLAFGLAVLFRLYQEVWSNALVVAGFYGAEVRIEIMVHSTPSHQRDSLRSNKDGSAHALKYLACSSHHDSMLLALTAMLHLAEFLFVQVRL